MISVMPRILKDDPTAQEFVNELNIAEDYKEPAKRKYNERSFYLALCQVLGCDSLNHAPLLDLELFLYLIYFTMILGMANKPSSAHLKIN